MEICLIWAQGRNREIGRENKLPWHLPEDLAHFKATTLGAPVIMGRKTFESLPGGALPGRTNIVMSRGVRDFSNAVGVPSLEAALNVARMTGAPRAFVIGGATIYEQALPIAHRLFITDVDAEVQGADAFAPVVPMEFAEDGSAVWQQSRKGLRFRIQDRQRSSYVGSAEFK